MVQEERKNILVITLTNIGDVILTTPVITSLHATFPGARFTVVAGPKAAPLLEGSSLIHRLLIYDKFKVGFHKLKLVRALREEFYDWVIDLRNTALPYLVRADRRSPIFRRYRERSARKRHLEVLAMCSLPIHEAGSFDFFSDGDSASLGEKIGKNGSFKEGIIVAPGAGSEPKRWPVEKFGEVISKMITSFPYPIFAVGDQRENFLCEKLSEVNPSRVFNLAGRLTLRELAALIAEAKLVLTNDSAAMHLAYELKRPVAAVFGPTDHEKYGRESEIWRIVRNPDFKNLSAEEVFESCKELLINVGAQFIAPMGGINPAPTLH